MSSLGTGALINSGIDVLSLNEITQRCFRGQNERGRQYPPENEGGRRSFTKKGTAELRTSSQTIAVNTTPSNKTTQTLIAFLWEFTLSLIAYARHNRKTQTQWELGTRFLGAWKDRNARFIYTVQTEAKSRLENNECFR